MDQPTSDTTNTTSTTQPPSSVSPKSGNGLKLALGGLSILAVLILAVVIANKGSLFGYNSRAAMNPSPMVPTRMPSRMPTPVLTITPGPINSKEGLMKALDEVDEQSSKAAEVIQSNINSLDEASQ